MREAERMRKQSYRAKNKENVRDKSGTGRDTPTSVSDSASASDKSSPISPSPKSVEGNYIPLNEGCRANKPDLSRIDEAPDQDW